MNRSLPPISLLAMMFAAASACPAIAQETEPLSQAAKSAEVELRQTFTNLSFEDFGPAPVKGPIYQASAGGRILYFAPESGHLLFATVYDRNGVNISALAQEERARSKLGAIDREKALTIGPEGAPEVIEFTDPDCPYCRDLERFWDAKAAEGKPVRRLVFFVGGNHPQAAAKAEHILCSPDEAAAFAALYRGANPEKPATCAAGHAKVEQDTALFHRLGTGATPTIIVDGKVLTGFQQAELQAFLDAEGKATAKTGP